VCCGQLLTYIAASLAALLAAQRKIIKEQLDQMQDQYDDARTRAMLLEGELRELQEADTQQQMYDLQNQINTLRQDKARLEQQLRTFDQMKQMLQG
jgi:uncharacterized protein YlxW (UPF0749 family)